MHYSLGSNPVLMLTRNNLALTKKSSQSLAQQTIAVNPWIIDNGSTDGTLEWLPTSGCAYEAYDFNAGVSFGWNRGLDFIFNHKEKYWPIFDHVLVINNDLVLPPWFYAELLSYDVPFVTGIAVDDMEAIKQPAERMPLTPNPDFSAFLIRREAWEKIGPFNERLMLYSGDQDYHVRGHRLGVGMWKANVPYFHQRSSTLNNASPQEQAVIRAQADADRATFRSIYGCNAPSPEYDALFK